MLSFHFSYTNKIREAVKNCLKLPKDTLPVLLYMPRSRVAAWGGNFKVRHTLMRKARLERLLLVTDPTVMAIAGSSFVADMLRNVSIRTQLNGVTICSKADLKRALTTELYRTVDGHGLRNCELSPDTNGWVDATNNLMSCANYIGAIHLRWNLCGFISGPST